MKVHFLHKVISPIAKRATVNYFLNSVVIIIVSFGYIYAKLSITFIGNAIVVYEFFLFWVKICNVFEKLIIKIKKMNIMIVGL